MSGHRPFAELTMRFTPERRARVDQKKAKLRAEAGLKAEVADLGNPEAAPYGDDHDQD